jgi:hypothetical protein
LQIEFQLKFGPLLHFELQNGRWFCFKLKVFRILFELHLELQLKVFYCLFLNDFICILSEWNDIIVSFQLQAESQLKVVFDFI